MAAAPTIPITIVNAEPAGAGVAFAIDGITYQAPAGSRRTWPWPPARTSPTTLVVRSASAGIGSRRVVYEFRSTPEGWMLYKLSGTP